jgi:transposase
MTDSLKIKFNDLTPKAQLRKFVLDAFLSNKIDRESAIKRLDISERQFIRILSKYRTNGESSLIHGLCNKPSNHSYDQEFKREIIKAYTECYDGFNYTHASEKLEELDGLLVHPNTLRNWLLASGISRRKYRSKTYHKRREPRKQFGQLVQLDGSSHDWFGDGKQYCLMHMVDDATKTSLAMLCEGETTHVALTILYQWCELYGPPEAIYSDRDSVYKVNEPYPRLTIEEELAGKTEQLTDFGKVCERLGIKQIYAYSAQAKGRVGTPG